MPATSTILQIKLAAKDATIPHEATMPKQLYCKVLLLLLLIFLFQGRFSKHSNFLHAGSGLVQWSRLSMGQGSLTQPATAALMPPQVTQVQF